ncbi:hypothetical protein BHM03_00020635 [Ensete ventricosum]|nr:hypothetical protein BHM03_00020635 [Ensete ventricosum]
MDMASAITRRSQAAGDLLPPSDRFTVSTRFSYVNARRRLIKTLIDTPAFR